MITTNHNQAKRPKFPISPTSLVTLAIADIHISNNASYSEISSAYRQQSLEMIDKMSLRQRSLRYDVSQYEQYLSKLHVSTASSVNGESGLVRLTDQAFLLNSYIHTCLCDMQML